MINPLDEMQTFIRIVEAGSITQAAEQLNTVKSAISRRLSLLEHRLGVTLLVRTTRKQTLTDAGQQYYQQCIRIIDDINDVESSLRTNDVAFSGRIKIAAPLSFGLAKLCPIFKQFNELHPDIEFDINFNDRQVNLIEEGYDLAIRIAQLDDSNLIARRLTSIRLMLCASPDYLQQHSPLITPDDLNHGHKKLHYQTANEHWRFDDKKGNSYNIKLPGVMTANNGDFLCQAAIEGYGLVYLPDFICQSAIESGQLQAVLTDYTQDHVINCYAVYPQTRYLSPRVAHLINFLSRYFNKD
ncbi:MAG: LysR family transcriptional regulator [Gammaproteobacteria bacterium]|nr:LysR family transcriptional regulator [Gammaproteobacteria bacterium]